MADDGPRNLGNILASIAGEHAALVTLRLLSHAPAFTSNTLVLGACLQAAGLSTSSDKLRSMLRRLDADGLLRVTEAKGLIVAELTALGGEVAVGLITAAGVAKPGPECPY